MAQLVKRTLIAARLSSFAFPAPFRILMRYKTLLIPSFRKRDHDMVEITEFVRDKALKWIHQV